MFFAGKLLVAKMLYDKLLDNLHIKIIVMECHLGCQN
jgi:hypothetical protein